LSKFCIKCGAELPDDAAFCLKCGASTEIKIENTEQEKSDKNIVESTGPAANDLKAALRLISEVENYIETTKVFNKSEFKGMERRLFDAEKLINNIKNRDETVKVLYPGTHNLFDCEQALSYNDYIGGRLGFDIACTIDMGRASKARAFKRAQINFQTSFDRVPNPESAFYYAVAMHEELKLKTTTTIMPQGKLKQDVYQAYQRVVDTWPDSEYAIEARKNQAQLQ
jgi:ribosomal protein L40E